MFAAWFLVVGGLLVLMALAGSVLKRLPLTSAMFYAAAGFALGPFGAGMLDVDMVRDARVLERVTEIVVVISLFTAGLKLRLPLRDRRWQPPLRLATFGMMLTVAALAAVGVFLLSLPLGAAVLLGAVLAPTDPVLASDVQVEHAGDREQVRFTLTGEAGLNDGTAFPFVMLGLGLLGLHDMDGGWRWLTVDLLWAIPTGLATGALCGTVIGRLVIYLRREHREAIGLDDFLALGLVALSYGAAILIHAYGFLAVFAAGLALRRIEREHSGEGAPPDVRDAAAASEGDATHPDRAPSYMAQAVLGFNEHLERLGEVGIVLVVGASLAYVDFSAQPLWFVPLLFLVVRPLAILVSLAGSRMGTLRRAFVGWFGVRGIGSLYYLTFAVNHGIDSALARQLADLTLMVIAASVIAHGISVTPLMRRYASSPVPGTPPSSDRR